MSDLWTRKSTHCCYSSDHGPVEAWKDRHNIFTAARLEEEWCYKSGAGWLDENNVVWVAMKICRCPFGLKFTRHFHPDMSLGGILRTQWSLWGKYSTEKIAWELNTARCLRCNIFQYSKVPQMLHVLVHPCTQWIVPWEVHFICGLQGVWCQWEDWLVFRHKTWERALCREVPSDPWQWGGCSWPGKEYQKLV